MRAAASFVVCGIFITQVAGAQTITVPTRLAKVACVFDQQDAVKLLTAKYLSGDGKGFHSHAVEVIAAVKQSEDCAGARINLRSGDVVQLLWVDRDATDKDSIIYHAIVQNDPSEPFGSALPGIESAHAFEVFVSSGSKDAVATAYTSTREPNPLEQQLPDFAKAIFDPLVTVLANTKAFLDSPPPKQPPSASAAYATVSQIMLPFARATVHVMFGSR